MSNQSTATESSNKAKSLAQPCSALPLAMEAMGAFNESTLEGSREGGACSGGRKEGGVCTLEGQSPFPGPGFFNLCH